MRINQIAQKPYWWVYYIVILIGHRINQSTGSPVLHGLAQAKQTSAAVAGNLRPVAAASWGTWRSSPGEDRTWKSETTLKWNKTLAGVSINGGTTKWLVYFMENPNLKWMMIWGTPMTQETSRYSTRGSLSITKIAGTSALAIGASLGGDPGQPPGFGGLTSSWERSRKMMACGDWNW